MQGYLHTASYYKQFAVDQRNVLLDEGILDLMARIPDPLRADKYLYFQAMVLRLPPPVGVPAGEEGQPGKLVRDAGEQQPRPALCRRAIP